MGWAAGAFLYGRQRTKAIFDIGSDPLCGHVWRPLQRNARSQRVSVIGNPLLPQRSGRELRLPGSLQCCGTSSLPEHSHNANITPYSTPRLLIFHAKVLSHADLLLMVKCSKFSRGCPTDTGVKQSSTAGACFLFFPWVNKMHYISKLLLSCPGSICKEWHKPLGFSETPFFFFFF